MTLGIDPTSLQLRIPAGAPYRLRLRIRNADGSYLPVSSHNLVMTIYAAGAVLQQVPAAISSDGTSEYALFALTGTITSTLATVPAPSWEIADKFSDGKSPLLSGAVYLAAAAPLGSLTGLPPSGSFDDATWSPAIQTLVVVPTGAGRDSFDYALNFAVDNTIYIPSYQAMTVDVGIAPIGTGALSYAKSSAAAPATFTATTLPATLEAGAYLKVTATGVVGFLAAHLRRAS